MFFYVDRHWFEFQWDPQFGSDCRKCSDRGINKADENGSPYIRSSSLRYFFLFSLTCLLTNLIWKYNIFQGFYVDDQQFKTMKIAIIFIGCFTGLTFCALILAMTYLVATRTIITKFWEQIQLSFKLVQFKSSVWCSWAQFHEYYRVYF
jgi:hypothetical protein